MFLAATFLKTESPPIHPTKVAAKKNITQLPIVFPCP